MSLIGQAFFSRELTRPFKPASMRTVAPYEKDDSAQQRGIVESDDPHRVANAAMPGRLLRRPRTAAAACRSDRRASPSISTNRREPARLDGSVFVRREFALVLNGPVALVA
jgi:hypothetical protein